MVVASLFTDTSPFDSGGHANIGPYDPFIISMALGLPKFQSLKAQAAARYMVIDASKTPACITSGWTRLGPYVMETHRLEYNCDVGSQNTLVPVTIVKSGKTDDLNSGLDHIWPTP